MSRSSSKKDVLEGPFLNATASDTTQPIRLPKKNSKFTNDSSNTAEFNKGNAAQINSFDTLIETLLHPISSKRIITISLISSVIFFIVLITRQKYILAIAIVISLLIGFYLGIIENSTTTDSRISRTSITKNNRR